MTLTPPQGAQSADPVREAAQALIDRYHAPSWKDGVPFVEFIQRLSTALAAPPAALDANAISSLLDRLCRASDVRSTLHREYMGKAMPNDVYQRFDAARSAVGELTRQIVGLAAPEGPAPTPQIILSLPQATHLLELYGGEDAEIELTTR